MQLVSQVDAFGRLPAVGAVFDDDAGIDATAYVEVRVDAHEARVSRRHQVGQDLIGDRFVKRALIAVGPEVQLQRLQFEARLVRYILDFDGGKVGLSSERAQAGEFRGVDVNRVVALGIGVVKVSSALEGWVLISFLAD